jgi:L-evernosamine nitrososynthase
MRASGSNTITFDGVELPEHGVRGGFRAGDPLPYMQRNLVAGPFHAAASLGIAESADHIARQTIAARNNGDARARMQIADNTIDLAAARAVLSRATTLIDNHHAANPASDGNPQQLAALFAEAQAAKAFVNDAAARIVDGARPLRRPPATSTAAQSRAPTATSRPAPSCTPSAPTVPTTTSPTPPSTNRQRCTELR